MATLINFNNDNNTSAKFTISNQGVEELSKVLFTTAFKESSLGDTCTLQSGIRDGAKLDYVDNLGVVGKAGRGCDPTYGSVAVKGFEKEWTLGDWNIANKICYTELKNTIAKFCLNTGTSLDELQNTDFWNKIMMPLLDKALNEFYWRVAWFGDRSATQYTSGGTGVITPGTDIQTSWFTMCDGLWKRLEAIVANDSSKKTTIAANTGSTGSAQKTAIRTSGVTTGILDNLLADADSRIANNGGKLMMTRSFYQAFRRDYALQYHATIPYMEVANGAQVPVYDGIPIIEVPEWDYNIAKFENDGTANKVLNKPHRVVFANPDNLLVGTSAQSHFADFDITFDKITRNNYMYAASNIGTLIAEDDLVQVAY